KRRNETGCSHLSCDTLNLRIGGIQPSIPDVFPDGSTEEMRLLRNNAQVRLQPVQASFPIVDTIDTNATPGRLIKTAKQFCDSTLAATGFSDKRDTLSTANP